MSDTGALPGVTPVAPDAAGDAFSEEVRLRAEWAARVFERGANHGTDRGVVPDLPTPADPLPHEHPSREAPAATAAARLAPALPLPDVRRLLDAVIGGFADLRATLGTVEHRLAGMEAQIRHLQTEQRTLVEAVSLLRGDTAALQRGLRRTGSVDPDAVDGSGDALSRDLLAARVARLERALARLAPNDRPQPQDPAVTS